MSSETSAKRAWPLPGWTWTSCDERLLGRLPLVTGEKQLGLERERVGLIRRAGEDLVDDLHRPGEIAPDRREPRLADARTRIARLRRQRRGERGAGFLGLAERDVREAELGQERGLRRRVVELRPAELVDQLLRLPELQHRPPASSGTTAAGA